ncbi:MAG: hypothetical protein LBS83_01010 [Holosporales bacterium]|nr:hypothetical protein [Holosporales bacterium]
MDNFNRCSNPREVWGKSVIFPPNAPHVRQSTLRFCAPFFLKNPPLKYP